MTGNIEDAVVFVPGHGLDGLDVKIATYVDGALRPVDMSRMRHAADTLAAALSTGPPVEYLVGLAGRGIIPTVICSQVTGLPFQIAYKNRLAGGQREIRFSEDHSRAKTLYFYPAENLVGARVCLVDDEITTGRTVVNAARALRKIQIIVVAALALVENTTGLARPYLTANGIALHAATRVAGPVGRWKGSDDVECG